MNDILENTIDSIFCNHSMKAHSGNHILTHHSTKNIPRAYVGKPTCLKMFFSYVNHENNYPYLNNNPNLKCQNVPHWKAGARIKRAIVDETCNDKQLKAMVHKYGAVVSVIYAGDQGFMDYKVTKIKIRNRHSCSQF